MRVRHVEYRYVFSNCFRGFVDDVDVHYRHARASGAPIESAPVDQPYAQRE